MVDSDIVSFIVFRSLDPRLTASPGVSKVITVCSRCGMAVTMSAASWDEARRLEAKLVCTHCITPEEASATKHPLTPAQVRKVVSALGIQGN